MLIGFLAPALRLVTWALDEHLGPRGTPMVSSYLEFLGNSLVLVAVTVVVCVGASVMCVNARRFSNPRLVAGANRASAAGYAVPGPVVAMGVVLALVAVDALLEFGGLGLPGAVATGSFIALVYAYVIRFLAPGMGTVEAGLGQVPDEYTSSARSLGARPTTVLGRIHLPLSKTSLLAAAILVGVDAAQGAAHRLPAAPHRLRHLAGVGLQPGVGVAVSTGGTSRDHHHRRGADSGRDPQPATRRGWAVAPSCPHGGGVSGGRTMTGTVSVSQVRKAFGETVAVADVSFELGPTELLALVGPSGCGKSTLLRMIAGLIGVDSGTITVGGHVMDDGRRRVEPEHRRTGLVFQEHALFPHLTVGENIAFGLRSVPKPTRATRWSDGCTRWACRATEGAMPTSCPAANASGWRWPEPSPRSPA